jgi:hypothetical protein
VVLRCLTTLNLTRLSSRVHRADDNSVAMRKPLRRKKEHLDDSLDNNGEVSWDLGILAANTGGQQRFTVLVDALAEGSLLDLNAATLSGTVNFQARQARSMAVSRVATEALEMTLEVNPDPVGPGQLLDAQIVISNPSLSTTGTLTLPMGVASDICSIAGSAAGCETGALPPHAASSTERKAPTAARHLCFMIVPRFRAPFSSVSRRS